MQPRLNFNLRSNAGTRTAVMCVVSFNSRQIRFSTGVSVNPTCWDRKRQMPCGDYVTLNDARNAAIATRRLTQIFLAFQDFLLNFAAGTVTISQVRGIVDNSEDMARPRKSTTATALLTQALLKSGVSESTKILKLQAIKKFEAYMKEKKLANSYLIFTENIIIQFHTWLTGNVSANTANNTASSVASLIKCIYTSEEYMHLGIPQPKPYKAVKDKRTKEEKKHIEILQEEYEAIRDYKGTPTEEKVAKAFYIQCLTGVRFSDLQIAISSVKGVGVQSIMTQKEGIYAQIEYTKEMVEICREIGDFNMSYGNYYTYLRHISKELNLSRQITYTDSDGKKRTEALYDVITSHCARVTKATQLMRQGISKDIIIRMLAWRDTAMLDRIYGQLTTTDNERQVAEALGVVKDSLEKHRLDILRKTQEAYKESHISLGKG